jgi:hypothetical protein
MKANNSSKTARFQSKQMYINFYRKTILHHYNLSFSKFVKLSQERRLELSLKVLPTTAKVVSQAFKITLESQCRRKRELEIAGKLQPSRKRAICPYTGAYAFLLTTDTDLFNSKSFGYYV